MIEAVFAVKGRIALPHSVVIASSLCLTGCASSISWNRSVSVRSHEALTIIHVDVPNKELHFNYHGGGVMNGIDRYTLTMPRHLDKVEGPALALSMRVNGEERTQALSAGSRVSLSGRTACALEIRLTDPSGVPYAVNGLYHPEGYECQR